MIFLLLALCFDLSIATVFQNDAPYLKEWIEFHRLVGVEHFWLYNNESDDNYQEVLAPYIEGGVVELIDWPGKSADRLIWNDIQCRAFMDAIGRAKGVSNWVAFIDTDEFLFALHEDSLPRFLRDYKKFAAVTANWQGFGTSHVRKLPEGALLIEELTLRNPPNDEWNRHVKSIVNPLYVTGCKNPHYFFFRDNATQVTAKKVPFSGPFSPTTDASLIRVNHYWFRDEEYLYKTKLPRSEHWDRDLVRFRERIESFNSEPDTAIFRFIPELKKRL